MQLKTIFASAVVATSIGMAIIAPARSEQKPTIEAWAAQAETGDVSAQLFVALTFATGLGSEQDYAKAARWYRRAAEQDEPNAQYMLGLMHNIGQGVAQDRIQAFKWWALAARTGHQTAITSLDFVRQNLSEAQMLEAERLVQDWRPRRKRSACPSYSAPA